MTFAILIELPIFIKKELLRLCLGLPSAEWQTEENLYINLHPFGKLTDQDRWDIIDCLGEIAIAPFTLKVDHLDFSIKRKNFGILWAVLKPSFELETLKKSIDSQLRRFNPYNHEIHSPSHIRLGTVQKESPERMADYFAANGRFSSSPFEIHDFILAQLHQTDKRSFYHVEKRYSLI